LANVSISTAPTAAISMSGRLLANSGAVTLAGVNAITNSPISNNIIISSSITGYITTGYLPSEKTYDYLQKMSTCTSYSYNPMRGFNNLCGK